MSASASSGDIGGGPTVTFGGPCGLPAVGAGAAGDLGHGNDPLHGTALGDLSVKLGVRLTENWWGVGCRSNGLGKSSSNEKFLYSSLSLCGSEIQLSTRYLTFKPFVKGKSPYWREAPWGRRCSSWRRLTLLKRWDKKKMEEWSRKNFSG